MYTVSDVTKKLGISRSTLLYYERGGLVVPERDPVNGYRLYSQGALDRLVMLKQLQKAGFSLAECRHFMDGDPDMALIRERLVHLEKELVEMTVARDLLRSLYHRITGDAPPEMAPADAREWHAEFEKRSADAHAAWLRKMGFSEKEALYIRWVSRDMHDNATYVNHIFHVFEQMKRQGPGSTEATLKAFGSIGHPEEIRSILDIGCGSGSASLVLAGACGAHITAVDNHQPFLDRLQGEVTRRGLEDRITPLNMSMHSLDFPENHFDLLWAEGSAYIVGVEAALSLWRPLIRDGGYRFTTDWGVANVLPYAFPGYIRTNGNRAHLPEMVLQIEPTREARNHPLLEGVFVPGVKGKWWLEQASFDMSVGRKDAVTILI